MTKSELKTELENGKLLADLLPAKLCVGAYNVPAYENIMFKVDSNVFVNAKNEDVVYIPNSRIYFPNVAINLSMEGFPHEIQTVVSNTFTREYFLRLAKGDSKLAFVIFRSLYGQFPSISWFLDGITNDKDLQKALGVEINNFKAEPEEQKE